MAEVAKRASRSSVWSGYCQSGAVGKGLGVAVSGPQLGSVRQRVLPVGVEWFVSGVLLVTWPPAPVEGCRARTVRWEGLSLAGGLGRVPTSVEDGLTAVTLIYS